MSALDADDDALEPAWETVAGRALASTASVLCEISRTASLGVRECGLSDAGQCSIMNTPPTPLPRRGWPWISGWAST